MNEATEAIYVSWQRRRDFTATVSISQFEEWQFANSFEFCNLEVPLNIDAIEAVFALRSRPTRVPERPRSTSLTIEERVYRADEGPEYFDADHFRGYTPLEGDAMGLFFILLLEQLP